MTNPSTNRCPDRAEGRLYTGISSSRRRGFLPPSALSPFSTASGAGTALAFTGLRLAAALSDGAVKRRKNLPSLSSHSSGFSEEPSIPPMIRDTTISTEPAISSLPSDSENSERSPPASPATPMTSPHASTMIS